MTFTRRLGHQPGLDGMRGLAVLLVVAHHATGLPPGGGIGVDVFFVLSGFLITSLLVGEWGSTGRISLVAFYQRRALRLLPALFGMLSAFGVGASALAVSGRYSAHDLEVALRSIGLGALYLSNVAQAWTSIEDTKGLRHLWSLALEEQFYLLWPPLLLLFLHKGLRPRALVALLSAGMVVSVVETARLHSAGAAPIRLSSAPDTRAISLLAGCLAGIVFSFRLRLWRPPWLTPIAALIVGFVITFHRLPGVAAVGVLPFVAPACAVLLLAVVEGDAVRLNRLMRGERLSELGRVSYGLYLWHWPLIVALGPAKGLSLALFATWFSYRYVEQPFLRRKQRLSSITVKPVVASTSAA